MNIPKYEWEVMSPADMSYPATGMCDDFKEAKDLAEKAAIKKYGDIGPGFRIRLYVTGDDGDYWICYWGGGIDGKGEPIPKPVWQKDP